MGGACSISRLLNILFKTYSLEVVKRVHIFKALEVLLAKGAW